MHDKIRDKISMTRLASPKTKIAKPIKMRQTLEATKLKNDDKCQLCDYVTEDESKLTEHLMSVHVLSN